MSNVTPSRIPLEIWFKIFKHLPVKPLGKCCCVCNSWVSLIRSPHFRDAHLKNFTQIESKSLLLYRFTEYTGCKTPEKEHYELFRESAMTTEGNGLELCHAFTCRIVARKENALHKEFRLIGSVYGLLCLVNDIRILLWNPIIQKSITLPISSINYGFSFGSNRSELGFGYDAQTNDHKVVKISYVSRSNGLEIQTPLPIVELYSVREGSWKQVSAQFLIDQCIRLTDYWSHCFLDGVLYWFTSGYFFSQNIYCLVSFNVEEEQFGKLDLSEDIVKSLTGLIQVLQYKGKLSVSNCNGVTWSSSKSPSCTIWVKVEDNNMGSSWCRIFNVVFDVSILKCPRSELYFGKNGELFGFMNTNGSHLLSYDPVNGEFMELGLRPCGFDLFSTYTESLILLGKNSVLAE